MVPAGNRRTGRKGRQSWSSRVLRRNLLGTSRTSPSRDSGVHLDGVILEVQEKVHGGQGLALKQLVSFQG